MTGDSQPGVWEWTEEDEQSRIVDYIDLIIVVLGIPIIGLMYTVLWGALTFTSDNNGSIHRMHVRTFYVACVIHIFWTVAFVLHIASAILVL